MNYEEQSTSPRMNRGIKSQINFLYSPKPDNLRFLVKDGISNKSPLVQTERSNGQNDLKSNHFEAITTDLYKSQKDVSSHLSYTQENPNQKESAILSPIEKKLFRKQGQSKLFKQRDLSEENKNLSQDNFIELEEEQTVSDDPENLKKLISEQSAAYMKLEEMYCQDTNSLKREIERLKSIIKRHDIDTSSYKTRIDQSASEIEDLQKRLSHIIKEKENLINQYEENLSNKTSEVFQMNEIISKLKIDRKSKDETIKDLQRQVLVSTNCNKILESDLNETKKQLARVQESSETSSRKLYLFDTQTQELSDIRNSKLELEEKLKEAQKSLDFVNNNYKVLQNKYNDAKEELEEKNFQLQETLNKLNESNSVSKTPAKPALRRTFTMNSSNNNPEAQKDNFNRLYSKISNLEEELNFEKMEKEKIARNLEYSKKIIDEKLQIVAKLEGKIQSDYLMQIEVVKESLAVNVLEQLDKCDKEVKGIQNVLTCQKCKSSCSSKFISWDCEHIFCKVCAMFRESCPCCSSGSRVVKLNLLKNVYSKLPQQLEAINNMRQLFKGRS